MMKIYNVMLVNLVADDECKKSEDEDRAEPQALITNQYKKCMQKFKLLIVHVTSNSSRSTVHTKIHPLFHRLDFPVHLCTHLKPYFTDLIKIVKLW